MKKKLYISLFLSICLIPLLFMPFLKNNPSKENRKLSDFPSLILKNNKINTKWSLEFEKYFSEHFAFREFLVTTDSLIKADIFHVSSNPKVIIGEKNWLYFSGTVKDFTASDIISERCACNTAKTLALIQEYCENQNSRFLFITAPNKNTVYPQFMPDIYIKSKNKNNISLINSKLDEYNVNYIDIVSMFSSQNNILYHSRDSHWTNEGAVLVYNAIMDYFNINHYDYKNTSKHTELIWNGDLDRIIFPNLDRKSEQVIYDYDFSFDYTYNFRSEDDLLISTQNLSKSVNILMFRDSFGRSLYPFIAENSLNSLFSREIPYPLNLLDSFNADFTVLEIVERNLSDLTKETPVMPAPSRNIDISASVASSKKNSCSVSKKNGLVQICGVLDEKYFNDNSEIFISLQNENSTLCFEAFPICEENGLCDYGYSLYINPSDIPIGQYTIYAYVKNNCGFICTDALESVNF